jgi:hypothetical protein
MLSNVVMSRSAIPLVLWVAVAYAARQPQQQLSTGELADATRKGVGKGTVSAESKNLRLPSKDDSLAQMGSRDGTGLTSTLLRIKQELSPWLHHLQVSAVVTTVALQGSPLRSVLEIRRAGDVMRYDGYPYFTVLAGALQWCIYGSTSAIFLNDPSFWTMVFANGPGIFLGIFYIFVFKRHCPKDDVRSPALDNYLMIGLGIVLAEIAAFVIFDKVAITWFGVLGAIGSAQIALSPFKTLPEVLKTKSTKSWPFDLCLWSFIQSTATGGFGFAIADPSIWVPNVIGVIAAGIQLTLVAMFRETSSTKDAAAIEKLKLLQ